MKRLLFTFLICLSGIYVFGQSSQVYYDLDWIDYNDRTSYGYDIHTIVVEGHFLDHELLPSFSGSFKIPEGKQLFSYNLTDIEYVNVSKSVFNNDLIGDEPVIEMHQVGTELRFTLRPIIKQNDQLKKIVSFKISYETRSRSFSRSELTKQVSNSVLASGNWFKFRILKTGIYKIDRNFLLSLGIDMNSVDPRTIKIYGNGGEMLPELINDFRYSDLQETAIQVVGESDGSFDNNDYIVFYGVGPHVWDVDEVNQTASHRYNLYSEEAHYFITYGGTNGKRVADLVTSNLPEDRTFTSTDAYEFHEKDLVNLFAIGKQWLGENLSINNVQVINVPFPNVDESEPVTVRVRGVAESSLPSMMEVNVEGNDVFDVNYSAASGFAKARAGFAEGLTFVNSGSFIQVQLDYDNGGNPSAKGYLDYIEVIGKQKLIFNSRQLGFRNFDALIPSEIQKYSIQNASQVWDVTDRMNPKNVQSQSGSNVFEFKVNSGSLTEYMAFSNNTFLTPLFLSQSRVVNQNLHGSVDVDYLIICASKFLGQARRLADYHEENGMKVQVVELSKIYNEFGSGTQDVTAIRDYVKYLYDNASDPSDRIKYLCLFGDGSYDYKDRITGNTNDVPVFNAFQSFNFTTSYVTDDYYGMLENGEGGMSVVDDIDIITGRIPVNSVLRAKNTVDKILNYYTVNSLGEWRTIGTLVADDIDQSFDATLQETLEEIAVEIEGYQPLLNLKKIYADSYVQQTTSGGDKYPDVKEAITNSIERGTLLLNYFGHGGPGGWAQEGILDVPQIQSLSNFDTQPLVITVTCEFSKFDDPLRESGGEFFMWNKDGGTFSMITTTREIFISVGEAINKNLMRELLTYDNGYPTISEALTEVKNISTSGQKWFVYYFGDPASKLAIPEPDIRLTHINGTDVSVAIDTIKALSKINLQGIVTDDQGNKLTNYNGVLTTTVFDKKINRKTLDNDNHGIIMDFEVLESNIFKGKATVTNGDFSFDFIAPKDLRIAYGTGKLSFYSDDGTIDYGGQNLDVVVGGVNPNAPEDNIGPEIQLYLNDETFVDGSITNHSPNLIVKLQDVSGINTSITSVDHDIVAVLDGDESNQIILNEFYETELDDYSRGEINYVLRDLEPGEHTLELCAWDTYNNNSCTSLSFVVVDGGSFELSNVLNYPNPFISYTEFWFTHNKPSEPLEVQVQIFTVSGKLIKTINQLVQSNGNLSRSVTWDGLDDFGDKIGKGTYVYRLSVRSSLSNQKAEKYEKLVILQ